MSAPLSDFEKAKVLKYLGYSIFEDDGPAVRAINSLASKPLAGDFIRPMLDDLDKVECEIRGLAPIALAISTGAVQTRVHYAKSYWLREGRRIVGNLSSFIKVSVFSDVFSSGAGRDPATFYSGDPSEHRIDMINGVPTVTSGD
jgi:hypothetical protein